MTLGVNFHTGAAETLPLYLSSCDPNKYASYARKSLSSVSKATIGAVSRLRLFLDQVS